MGKLVLSYQDNSEESCTATITGNDMTAATFDAEVAMQTALRTAIGDIVMGDLWKTVRTAYEELSTKAIPADKNAQRERKWLVLYEDLVTHKRYTVELPCADLQYLEDGKDTMDLSLANPAAFVSAFQAYAQSPTGHSCQIRTITHVGRRL